MRLSKCLELIFPSNIYCIACGSIIDESRPYALCDQCIRTFRWANTRTCEKCGKILQENYMHKYCNDCRETEHIFTKGYACVQYGIHERDLVLSYKYGGKAYIGEKLAQIMFDRIEPEAPEFDLIIPVPLHKTRKKTRGYNQAGLMAKHLARKMDIPFDERTLLRVEKTGAMSRLSPAERRQNIEHAFAVQRGMEKTISAKRVLLIDDIFTTGSTADACSLALINAGASEVYLFCFAIGANLIQNKAE